MRKIIVPKDIEENIINDYLNGESVLSLSKKYGYKYDKTRSIITNNGLAIRGNNYNSKIYKNDSFIFDEIDTEEKAYWLGFLYADGCICKNLSNLKMSLALSIKDIEHLEKFRNFLKTDAPIQSYNGNHNNTYCRLSLTDRHLCEQLIEKGIYERKTEIITFPTFLDESLIRHFIRGYVDGDGCITYHIHNQNQNRFVFSIKICSTKEMLCSIHQYLPLKNKKEYPTLEKRHNNDVNNYSVSYGGNLQVLNILNYLYENSNIYLQRKYERYLLLKNFYSNCSSRLYW